MGFIIAIVIIIFVVIGISNLAKMQNKTYAKALTSPPWADKATEKLFRQFNDAWSHTIEDTVNARLLAQGHHFPKGELAGRWYELKKFLFLAGISKGLPMFSQKVDDLWHVFLDEKELYRTFCHSFIGEEIEHHPHGEPKQLPSERAWFDLLYVSFFTISKHSHLWGNFIQRKDVHADWLAKIIEDRAAVHESLKRTTLNSTSNDTLNAFLQFASKQLLAKDSDPIQRTWHIDGYWYGAALLALHSNDLLFQLEEQKKNDTAYVDSSGGFVSNDEERKEWDEMISHVNHFEDNGSSTSSHSTNNSSNDNHSSHDSHSGSDGDSGSSCSSCSSCSS